MQIQARTRPILLLAALLLTAGAAFAQTSKALLREGEDEQYLTLKRTFQRMVDEGEIEVAVRRDGGAVDLNDCTYGQTYLGPGANVSSRTGQLVDLAYEVVRLKKLMQKLGYPDSVWRPLLLEIEEDGQEEFDLIGSGHLEELSETLNDYRQGSAPSLPRTKVQGGCGEGEVGVRIATRPLHGRVWLIPVFFYKLCQVQKIDPDNPRRCDHWREPAEGALFEVSGDYVYQASWRDGARRTGRLSFTYLDDGQTVTISKP